MFQRNLLFVVLLSVFIYAQSASVETSDLEVVDAKDLTRQRRQVTVPELVTALGVFLGQLLVFVSNLLFSLAGSLPIILGALGLGGLGVSLAIIVAQLGVLVGLLSGRKRRQTLPSTSATSKQAIDRVKAAIAAERNATALTTLAQKLDVTAKLTVLQTKIEALQQALGVANPVLTGIQTSLKGVLNDLNGAVDQIRTTINSLTGAFYPYIATISNGLTAPLFYLQGLGPNIGTGNNRSPPGPVRLILQNIGIGQNQTFVSVNNFGIALFAITNVTISLLQFSTLNLGNTTAQQLLSCLPNIVPYPGD